MYLRFGPSTYWSAKLSTIELTQSWPKVTYVCGVNKICRSNDVIIAAGLKAKDRPLLRTSLCTTSELLDCRSGSCTEQISLRPLRCPRWQRVTWGKMSLTFSYWLVGPVFFLFMGQPWPLLRFINCSAFYNNDFNKWLTIIGHFHTMLMRHVFAWGMNSATGGSPG